MEEVRIVAEEYAGEGISRGLARGLLVYHGDCNLTGEGMGIGSVALRARDGNTFFSRSWEDRYEGDLLFRTYTLDTCMRWGRKGQSSAGISCWIEAGITAYMRLPRLQGLLMRPVSPLRTLLKIDPVFETVPPRGSVTVACRVTEGQVDVAARISGAVRQGDTVCLLNELSAAWFTLGHNGETPTSPPPGWEYCPPGREPLPLFDPVHNLLFSMEGLADGAGVPLTLCRGREQSRDLCWAGFALELGPLEHPGDIPAVRYTIRLSPGVVS